MFAQNTRLELAIVGTVFVVLLLCRQPPKSGNAGVAKDPGLALPRAAQGMEDRGQKTDGRAIPSSAPGIDNLQVPNAQSALVKPSADTTTTDNTSPDAPMPPKTKLMGVVDATKCDSLNYKDVMFGEVTVERVWNGQKYVFKKVCQVKEKNGTISTWVFDDRDDIVVSPIDQPQQ